MYANMDMYCDRQGIVQIMQVLKQGKLILPISHKVKWGEIRVGFDLIEPSAPQVAVIFKPTIVGVRMATGFIDTFK